MNLLASILYVQTLIFCNDTNIIKIHNDKARLVKNEKNSDKWN